MREPGRCPHDPRPGTVVCLYCRHEEHLAGASRRRARGVMVGGVVLAAVMVVAAVAGVRYGYLGFTASDSTASDSGPPAVEATTTLAATSLAEASLAEESAATDASRDSALPVAPPAGPAPVGPPPVGPTPAGPTPAPARHAPIVAEGRTVLPGGLFAIRTGDTVEVHFDTPDTRTRRAEKFERIVRATLPAVYGAVAGDALAGVPAGQLVDAAGLLEELPERGVRLPTAGGGTLVVWPATRPGRDGPLVITYRATLLP